MKCIHTSHAGPCGEDGGGSRPEPFVPSPGLLSALPEEWQRIVVGLLNGRECSVDELATTLGLSKPVVRKNLMNLLTAGLVTNRFVRHGRGRPARLFSLAPLSRGLFPTSYSMVASELFEAALSAGFGDEEEIAELIAHHSRRRLLHQVAEKPIEERVALVCAHLERRGFIVESSVPVAGSHLLTVLSCPMVDVALQYPAICASMLETLRQALEPATVRRLNTIPGGAGSCGFSIQAPRAQN